MSLVGKWLVEGPTLKEEIQIGTLSSLVLSKLGRSYFGRQVKKKDKKLSEINLTSEINRAQF